MTDKTDKYWNSMSNNAIVEILCGYIRHHRLEQNKTQTQLAQEAGISRSTLSEFEQGMRSNITTLINLLRALNLLNALEVFQVQQQISPIQLAELEQAKRKRASRTKKKNKKNRSNW